MVWVVFLFQLNSLYSSVKPNQKYKIVKGEIYENRYEPRPKSLKRYISSK
jgi:hypothetical protein